MTAFLEVVSEFNSPLRFSPQDHVLLSIDDVSMQLRVSRAFVRLCIGAGCPSSEMKISAAGLLEWLFEHYPAVRHLAGFSTLAEVDGTPSMVMKRLKMGNAVMTLLEFGESRASDPEEKAQLRGARRQVEQALERA